VTFDPTTLAGKVLWLRAKDNTGGDGSAVSTWADQSGGGRDGVAAGTSPTVATASTPLGGKSLRFGGAVSYFKFGGTATASSNAGPGTWDPLFAFDGVGGDGGHAWASFFFSPPQWLQAQVFSPRVATGYSIMARHSDATQAPNTWTFLGSNDGSSWTTLDTQSAQTFTVDQVKSYTFSNSTAYSYYRINITAINGGTSAAIAELTIDNVTTNTGDSEIWAVIKSDGSSNAQGHWTFDNGFGAGDEGFYPFTDGSVYESFGTKSGVHQSFTPSLAVTSWRIYRVRVSGTAWAAYLDGVSQATATITGSALTPFAPTLGVTKNVATPVVYFMGNIAEILVRSQVSTTQEVTDITAYLTAEHFVAATPGAPRRATIVASRAAQRASRW